MTENAHDAVAVVGMGMLAPGCESPEAFWRVLQQPQPQFTEPGDRWDLTTLYAQDPSTEDRLCHRRMGYIHADFPAHPRTDTGAAPHLDELGRWLRHCVLQALENVHVRERDHTLVSVGATAEGSQRLEESVAIELAARLLSPPQSTADQTRHLLKALYPLSASSPATYLPYRQAAAAVADLLPHECELTVVDSACSTASYALDAGYRALNADECDLAICGASFVLSRRTNVLFSQMGGYTRSGDLRAFDRAASGTLFSDGAAVVILKRYSRALADGDPIHGVILGIGGSTDGRGRGIMAPNPVGQLLAFTRALEHAGIDPDQMQWVAGHGTGTAVGDRREMEMLRKAAAERARWQVTSNKSLIGHTGWAAGLVSVIHVLLAMKHGVIPAQQRYETPPDPTLLGRSLTIPVKPVPWPTEETGRPRMAAVCSYGLGGTNCCVILGDRPPRKPRAGTARDRGEVVVTAWHAHLPGNPDLDFVQSWLRTGEAAWPDAFEDPYPDLPGELTTLPPATHASLDRSHLMTMDAAAALARHTGACWAGDAARTGVFIAHSGPTRGSAEYALRAGAEDLAQRIARSPSTAVEIDPSQLVANVRHRIPRGDSDTFTGFISNVMASRVAVQFDLHGPALAFDTGTDSTLSAVHAARRWLAAGDIDYALVFAVCANTAYGAAITEPDASSPIREGVFALVLTRADTARKAAHTPLAVIAAAARESGEVTQSPWPTHHGFLGAESAVVLLRALTGVRQQTVVGPLGGPQTPPLKVSMPLTDHSREGTTGELPHGQSRTGPYFLRRPATRGRVASQWHVTWDEVADRFLYDHVVQGRPTLPGAMLLEMAAEAAADLVPGLDITALTEVTFESFVRLPTRPFLAEPAMVKVSSALHARDGSGATVAVRITGDIVQADGTALSPDRLHAHMNVHLGQLDGQPQVWHAPTSRLAAGSSGADIYRRPDSPVRLDGVFASLEGLLALDYGGRARWAPSGIDALSALESFHLPAVLIDGLMHLTQLRDDDERDVPAATIPIGIRHLRLYTRENDTQLARTGPISLHLVHRRNGLNHDHREHLLAIASDQRILVDIADLDDMTLARAERAVT